MEPAAVRMDKQPHLVAGGRRFHFEQHLRPLVIGIAVFDFGAETEGVLPQAVAVYHEGVYESGIGQCAEISRKTSCLIVLVHGGDAELEVTTWCREHADGLSVGVWLAQIVKHKLAFQSVAVGCEIPEQMEIAISVVSGGGDKDHAAVGEVADAVGNTAGPVVVLHVVNAPAHIDNQPFLLFFGHVVQPLESVHYCLFVQLDGDKQEFGVVGDASVFGACTGSSRNGGDMGAVIAVLVDAEGVTLGFQQSLLTHDFGAVAETFRCRSGGPELVPCAKHAVTGHGCVVEHRVGVVKAPIGNTNDDPFSGKALRKAGPVPYIVHLSVRNGFVQQLLRGKRQAEGDDGGDDDNIFLHIISDRFCFIPDPVCAPWGI